MINKIKAEQKNILYQTYLGIDECTEIISQKNHRLWERKI